MKTTLILISALLVAPALAAKPNLQPGQWEYEMTTESSMPMLDGQSLTNSECLTQEQIDEQDLLHNLEEGCELIEQDIRADGMTYAARCSQDGMSMVIRGEGQFMGDRADGTMVMDMETPMGEITTTTRFKGTRTGDCE